MQGNIDINEYNYIEVKFKIDVFELVLFYMHLKYAILT